MNHPLPISNSTNSLSKKRKNIGDDSAQPQKKYKSESTQTSRGKQNATDKENRKTHGCNVDSSFKLSEFQVNLLLNTNCPVPICN